MKNLKIIFCVIFLGAMFYESSAIALNIINNSGRYIQSMESGDSWHKLIIAPGNNTWNYGGSLLISVCKSNCSGDAYEIGRTLMCPTEGLMEITITGVTSQDISDSYPTVSGTHCKGV